jgi:hypothetical protein
VRGLNGEGQLSIEGVGADIANIFCNILFGHNMDILDIIVVLLFCIVDESL